jgi:hypothetical protein
MSRCPRHGLQLRFYAGDVTDGWTESFILHGTTWSDKTCTPVRNDRNRTVVRSMTDCVQDADGLHWARSPEFVWRCRPFLKNHL